MPKQWFGDVYIYAHRAMIHRLSMAPRYWATGAA